MSELNLQYENIGKKMPKVSSVFIETLKNHKVDRFFCVPGESYLPVMNELVSNPIIDVVTCRHEGVPVLCIQCSGHHDINGHRTI